MATNNGSEDQKKAIENTKKTAQQIKKFDDKRKKPVKQAQNLAKNYAKNYGKQQAKKYASKAAKEVAKKAAEAAKKVAEQVGKAIAKAAKAIGKALAEAIKGIGQAIASMGPYGWIALAIILILVCCYGAAVYNSDKISHWLIGDSSADGSIFSSTYYDDARDLKAAIESGAVDLGNDLPMLSREDVLNILDHVIQYNDDMSMEVGIGCQYDEWPVSRNNILYGFGSDIATIDDAMGYLEADSDEYKELAELKLTNGYTDASLNSGYELDSSLFAIGQFRDVLAENMSYGQIATLDVAGTAVSDYYNGTYDIDWKLMLILCEMMAETRAGSFGNNSEWTAEDQESLNTSGWFETSMDGYFVTDEDIMTLCKLFDYKIFCYPNDLGRDYVQIGMLYHDGTYTSVSNAITNISIKWGGITTTYNDTIETCYPSDVVKRMSFTLYPATNINGNKVMMSNGIIKRDPNNIGSWTYLAPYATGRVFDGDSALIVDAAGNTAVRYVSTSDGTVYVLNDSDMDNYRAVKNLFVPYIAPMSIANVLMRADYIYEDVDKVIDYTAEELGMNAGTKMLSRIEVTVDADNFYTQINQVIPGFSFEHFFELYSYYKCNITDDERRNNESLVAKKEAYNAQIDEEIARWKKIEELYKKGIQARNDYTNCVLSGIAPPFSSEYEARQQATATATLPFSAISGPTEGYIFIGDYSQNRSSSGSAADITGRSGVWIGESHGKRYYDFFDVEQSAKASIIRQDKLIEEDDETAFEKLQIICDTLYHQVLYYGYEMNEGVSNALGYAYTTEYTKLAFPNDCGGPVWIHFCSCSCGLGEECPNHEGEYGTGIEGDTHNNNYENAYKNTELINYLLEWQKENPDYSVTAMLTLLVTRAYMDDNPWILDTTERYDVSQFDTTLLALHLATEGHVGNAYTNIDMVTAFLESRFNDFKEQIDKGPTSFFDMEFGHGFNNKTIAQSAYEEAEIKYTYGNLTSNPTATPWIGPEKVGVYPAWWQDKFFPAENIGQIYVNDNDKRGWCNFAGQLRATILKEAGYSCWGTGNWPLGAELGEGNIFISSPFGYRLFRDKSNVVYYPGHPHGGIDIACPEGTPVLSTCDGYVNDFGWAGDAGYMITINGDDGYIYKFMHLTANSCEKYVTHGGRVTAGMQIGESGNTGGSQGPHLHFQMQEGATAIDPAPYLGLDETNPYWKTHPVYYTEQEAWDAYNGGKYNP